MPTLILEIAAMGFEPVPWSVPDIGVSRRGGKNHRFARRPGKTDKATGALSLRDWQDHIAGCAKDIMIGRELEAGPLHVEFEFVARTPPGHRHGELWDIRLEWNGKTKAWVKRGREGWGRKTEPDLTNLQKAAEDALGGVVWVDDCKNRSVASIALLGPVPGVRIFISRIEAEDYPGHGEPMP